MESPSLEEKEAVLQCPSCRSRLRVGREVSFFEEDCPVCRSRVSMTIFPRLFREFSPMDEGAPIGEGEAGCTFFPELRADKVCDECGCFLSDRATVSWADRDLCLPCLHRLREEGSDPVYVARTRLYDKWALALVTLLAPFSLFTAPLALFLLIRYRKAPLGFVPRSRAIWWSAMILSLLWITFWTVLIVIWTSLILEQFT
jgi:hypothetical protein